MRTYIKVPIKIITPKLAQNKQDSFFYAGKNIAEVKVQDKTYVLTTAGEYRFSLEESGPSIFLDSSDRRIGAGAPGGISAKAFRTLTDAKIKTLNDNNLISNWGWFGINVWGKEPTIIQTQPGNFSIILKDKCLNTPTEVWSGSRAVNFQYDEALLAFIEYVEQDLTI